MYRNYEAECKNSMKKHGIGPGTGANELKYGLLKYLSLADDEEIQFACHCVGKRTTTHSGNVVITNSKVIIMLSKLGGADIETYTYSQIANVSEKIGMLVASIEINTTGDKRTALSVGKKEAAIAAKCIRDNILSISKSPVGIHNNKNSNDFVEQLEKLMILRDREVISEAEFQTLKNKIINS